MKLWSNDFQNNQDIPSRFTCDGENISPHLAWSDPPPGTESLALICHDPDAPVGDWIHWFVHDIPPLTRELSRGGPPPAGAKEVVNDFGYSRYGGPCPPSGRHRYYFILHALKEKGLKGLDKKNFRSRVEAVSLARAECMGTYARAR